MKVTCSLAGDRNTQLRGVSRDARRGELAEYPRPALPSLWRRENGGSRETFGRNLMVETISK